MDVALAHQSAPASSTLLLQGHQGPVYTVNFAPPHARDLFASGSFDSLILLWRDGENVITLRAHHKAVVDLAWHDDESLLVSSSADGTAILWDYEIGEKIRRFRGHDKVVNSCSWSQDKVVTASDDGSVRIWDCRMRNSVDLFTTTCPVTTVAAASDGTRIFSAGVDPNIAIWDIRQSSVIETLKAHTDIVTGLDISRDGRSLVSNAMDNKCIAWNIQPFIGSDETRQLRTFSGSTHNFEQNLLRCDLDGDCSMVSAGSADRFVYIWDFETASLLYKLPGHKGSVNQVAFHPTKRLVVSASNDKTLFWGKLD